MQNPFDFSGHRAVVTGAGSGIGKATALMLLEHGASVVAADLREESLADVAEAGGEALPCDVTQEKHRQRLVEAAGACDHLVNAAGVIRLLPIDEVREEDFDAVYSVNARALFFCCQAFGRVLRDGGAIVNLSSVAGRDARTLEAAVYASSKAAVISITRSFAYAYAKRGVCVNAVLPGIVDTPMQEKVLEDMARIRGTTPERLHELRLANVPLGRTASASDCAQAILFLLSPAASYVTGQAVAIDGGYTMI
jgi:NAD(P)-dependent dehydrogenase (short-subunit alcohol dehydrogenase family)